MPTNELNRQRLVAHTFQICASSYREAAKIEHHRSSSPSNSCVSAKLWQKGARRLRCYHYQSLFQGLLLGSHPCANLGEKHTPNRINLARGNYYYCNDIRKTNSCDIQRKKHAMLRLVPAFWVHCTCTAIFLMQEAKNDTSSEVRTKMALQYQLFLKKAL